MKNRFISLVLIFQITLILIISKSQLLLPTLANDNIVIEPGQSIQEAINNAYEGQTIYLKKGEYLIEKPIIVNKTITLIGEHTNETTINGQGKTTLILSITANAVEIQNLTIRNSSTEWYEHAGIQTKNVTNIKIKNCHIKNCATGVILRNSNQCKISRNLIKNNTAYGIYFTQYSSYNQIFWNTIKNNSQAISIDLGCSKNKFYQNNFIQNKIQTSGLGVPANLWNTTYPTGGNYWSDHTATDIRSGPYQNETGSDGIGDECYELPLGARDYYPTMGFIHCFFSYRWESIDYYTLVSTNISDAFCSNFHFNSNDASINFTLTGTLETGFCRVAVPKQLLWVDNNEWLVTINNNETEYTCMTDANYTYICFAYNYSNTQTIKIKGTHAIPEFPSITVILLNLVIIIAFIILKITKNKCRTAHRSKFQKT